MLGAMNAVTDIFTILCFIYLFLFVKFASEDCVSCDTEMVDVILKVIRIEIPTHLSSKHFEVFTCHSAKSSRRVTKIFNILSASPCGGDAVSSKIMQ